MNEEKPIEKQEQPKELILQGIQQFLEESSIYESLPQNSQILVLDKHFSCYDAFHVLVENDQENLITWNSEISTFDGIITFSDIAEIIITFFKNIMQEKSNKKIYEEKNSQEQYQMEEELGEMEGDSQVQESELTAQGNQEIPNKDPNDAIMEELQQSEVYLPPFDPTKFEYTEKYKEQFLNDLKSISLKS